MPALGRAFRAYIRSNLVVAMRTESVSRSSFYLTACFALGLLFLTFTPSHDANAQDISYCERYSDVRPNAHSESPREKCQCAIDSSYCIQPASNQAFSSNNTSHGSSPERTCKNKNNHVWTGSSCWSCSKLATRALASHTLAVQLLPKLGISAAWSALTWIYIYVTCRAIH